MRVPAESVQLVGQVFLISAEQPERGRKNIELQVAARHCEETGVAEVLENTEGMWMDSRLVKQSVGSDPQLIGAQALLGIVEGRPFMRQIRFPVLCKCKRQARNITQQRLGNILPARTVGTGVYKEYQWG